MNTVDPNFLSTQEPAQEGRNIRRPIFFVVLTVALLIVGGCAVWLSYPGRSSGGPLDYDPVTLEPKEPEGFFNKIKHLILGNKTPLAGEKDDRINILLLGMGGIGHDGPYLTDTVIIASIKPSTNQIAMVSIPRDLGVDIPGHGIRKINYANAAGEVDKENWGAAFATEVIEKTFETDIQYYVRVDFAAFKEIIDEVEGVTINVDTSFVDPMYPAANDGYQTLTFKAGTQTMNGERALQYARSRHGSNGEGSDFARARRQQKVLLALKEKMLSFKTLTNPVTIYNITKSLEKHITTNMEFPDIIAMIKMLKELDTDSITSLVLDNGQDGFLQNAYSYSGAFILEPKAGDFSRINQSISHIFEENYSIVDDTPEQVIPEYSPTNIEIQNGTWRVGLAARMEKRLTDRGFKIEKIGNTITRPVEKSGIYSIGEPTYDVLDGLEKELHIPVKQSLPEGITVASSTKILIVFGENMEE